MKNKIDVEFYRSAKSDFIANLRRRNVNDFDKLNSELSLYCACFGLPVIAGITFALEEFPEFKDQLEKKKDVVREFYGYE